MMCDFLDDPDFIKGELRQLVATDDKRSEPVIQPATAMKFLGSDPVLTGAWLPETEDPVSMADGESSDTSCRSCSPQWPYLPSFDDCFNYKYFYDYPCPSPDTSDFSYQVYHHMRKREEKERRENAERERALRDHRDYCADAVVADARVPQPQSDLPLRPIHTAKEGMDISVDRSGDRSVDSGVESMRMSPCSSLLQMSPPTSLQMSPRSSLQTSPPSSLQTSPCSSPQPLPKPRKIAKSKSTRGGKRKTNSGSSSRPTSQKTVKRLTTKSKPVSQSRKLDQSALDKKEKNQIKAEKEKLRRHRAREILNECRETLHFFVPGHVATLKTLSEQKVLDCESEILFSALVQEEKTESMIKRAYMETRELVQRYRK